MVGVGTADKACQVDGGSGGVLALAGGHMRQGDAHFLVAVGVVCVYGLFRVGIGRDVILLVGNQSIVIRSRKCNSWNGYGIVLFNRPCMLAMVANVVERLRFEGRMRHFAEADAVFCDGILVSGSHLDALNGNAAVCCRDHKL